MDRVDLLRFDLSTHSGQYGSQGRARHVRMAAGEQVVRRDIEDRRQVAVPDPSA